MRRVVVGSSAGRVNPGRAGYFFLMTMTAVILLFGGMQSTAQTSTKPAPVANTGPVQKGKRIYMSIGCYECHGREGQGSRLTGPQIGPDPIALSAFVQYIRQPAGQMPPYTSKVVSDAELADIYAFLKSLPKPPAAKSIPALN